jgi:translation elongation factor EF-Ts
MSCNTDFVAKRETISWLIDVIHLEDMEFDTNYTEDTHANETEATEGEDTLDRYAYQQKVLLVNRTQNP